MIKGAVPFFWMRTFIGPSENPAFRPAKEFNVSG
jgi:hypothetical protein